LVCGKKNSQDRAEVEKKTFFLLLIAKSWGHKAVKGVKKCQKFTFFSDYSHRRLSFRDDKQALLDPFNKFSTCNTVLLTRIFSSSKI
jgi:hypothetical protein